MITKEQIEKNKSQVKEEEKEEGFLFISPSEVEMGYRNVSTIKRINPNFMESAV